MSGPKPRTVPFVRSGFLTSPPIGRAEAEAAFGSEIPEAAWSGIQAAFRRFGDRLSALGGPRVNNDRGDPRSYTVARDEIEADLEEMLSGLQGMSERHDMLRTIARVSMARPDGALMAYDLPDALRAAEFALRQAHRIVVNAKYPPTVTGTEVDARKALAREVRAVLTAHGLPRKLTGWSEARAESDLTEADMEPAERLISALRVHPAASPSAFVRRLRDACRSE